MFEKLEEKPYDHTRTIWGLYEDDETPIIIATVSPQCGELVFIDFTSSTEEHNLSGNNRVTGLHNSYPRLIAALKVLLDLVCLYQSAPFVWYDRAGIFE